MEDMNNTTNQINIVNIYRTTPATVEYVHFSNACDMFNKKDH